MANNLVAKKITIAAAYAPLSSSQLVADVTLLAHSGNLGDVILLGDDDQEVPIEAGEQVRLRGVDLSGVNVKGTVDDVLAVIGTTRFIG